MSEKELKKWEEKLKGGPITFHAQGDTLYYLTQLERIYGKNRSQVVRMALAIAYAYETSKREENR